MPTWPRAGPTVRSAAPVVVVVVVVPVGVGTVAAGSDWWQVALAALARMGVGAAWAVTGAFAVTVSPAWALES